MLLSASLAMPFLFGLFGGGRDRGLRGRRFSMARVVACVFMSLAYLLNLEPAAVLRMIDPPSGRFADVRHWDEGRGNAGGRNIAARARQTTDPAIFR
jgi:hypothetical protein